MAQPEILIQAVVTCMEIVSKQQDGVHHFPIRCGHTIVVERASTIEDIDRLREALAKHLRAKHNMEIE